MCEYNRPYPIPFGQHPDDHLPRITPIASAEAWAERVEQLPPTQADTIEQAIQDAAMIAADVHLYRSPNTPVLGISLEPGTGPNVLVWEH